MKYNRIYVCVETLEIQFGLRFVVSKHCQGCQKLRNKFNLFETKFNYQKSF